MVQITSTNRTPASAAPSDRPPDHNFFLFEWNDWLLKHLNMDALTLKEFYKDAKAVVRTTQILGLKGQAYIKSYMGKDYLIFKGLPGSRPADMRGTRYLANNPKVNFIAAGVKEIAHDATHTVIIGMVVYTTMDVARAIFGDYNTFGKFAGHLATDIGKCVASSLVAVGTAALAVAGAAVFGVTLGAAAPMIVALIAGAVAGAALESLDRKFGVTESLCKGIDREIAEAKLSIAQARRQAEADLDAIQRAVRDFERFAWTIELLAQLLLRIAPHFTDIPLSTVDLRF